MLSKFQGLRERSQKWLDGYVPRDKQWIVYATGAAVSGYYVYKAANDAYTQRQKLAEYEQLGQAKRDELATKPHTITDEYISKHKNTLLTKEICNKVINTMSAIDIRNSILDLEYTCQQILCIFILETISQNKRLNALMEQHYDTGMLYALELDNLLLKYKTMDANNYKEILINKMPLFGVPLSVKDLIEMKNSDCTNGILKLCMKNSNKNGEIINLFKSVGAIPYVKTTTPQLNMLPETLNNIMGHTKNPYDISRSPGGSSGGEAALVGSKASILGIGTDIGGSLRMPAHFSGCMAYKSSSHRTIQKGRLITTGSFSDKGSINASTGPLGRYVDDIVQFNKIWFNRGPYESDCYMAPILFRDEIYQYKIGQSNESVKQQQRQLLKEFEKQERKSKNNYNDNNNNNDENGGISGINDIDDETKDNGVTATATTASTTLPIYCQPKLKGKLRIGYYYNDGWMTSTEPIRRAIDKVVHVLTTDLGYECIKLTNIESNKLGFDIIRMYLQYMGAEGNLKDYVRALDGEPFAGGYRLLHKASYIPNIIRELFLIPLLKSNMVNEHRVAYLSKINKNGGLTVRELRGLIKEINNFRYNFFDNNKINNNENYQCDLFISPVCFYPALPLHWSDKLTTSVTGTLLQNILDCASASFGPVTYVRESECHYNENLLNLPKYQQDSWQKLINNFMKNAKGLPVNVQIFGRQYDDELVLRLMKELEVYIEPTKLDKEKEMQE